MRRIEKGDALRLKTHPKIFKTGDVVFFRTETLSGAVTRALQRQLHGDVWWAEASHVATCIGSPDTLLETLLPKTVVRENGGVFGRSVLAVASPNLLAASDKCLLHRWAAEELTKIGRWNGLPQSLKLLWLAANLANNCNYDKNPVKAGKLCAIEVGKAIEDIEKTLGFQPRVRFNKYSLYPSDLLIYCKRSQYWTVDRPGQ